VIEFQLPDMSCAHCASKVTKALKQVDPRCRIDIDLTARTVKVQSTEDSKELARALGDAGYPPA
jgi:copper chaperone